MTLKQVSFQKKTIFSQIIFSTICLLLIIPPMNPNNLRNETAVVFIQQND